jgi:phosphatidate cytidylyltransferase
VNPVARVRLFDPSAAFDHPATIPLLAVVGLALLLPRAVVFVGSRFRFLSIETRVDVRTRYRPWLVIVPVVGVPILAGAFWTILGCLLLGVFCFREYGRVTGLFREKLVAGVVIAGVVCVHLAALDNWYRLFVALAPLTVAAIAGLAVLPDRPKGYVQRVALGVFGFALCGVCLGHLAFLANDTNYRPVLILVLVAVELNDVAAFVSGRLFGQRKLCPQTSPNKTVGGAMGAVVATTLFALGFGRLVFTGTPLDHTGVLAGFGALISVTGQFGDLVLSSIKRDVGIKDTDNLIPGHGGLLDRFDSLILVAPVAFHVVNYFVDVGVGQPVCVFTGAR